MSGRTFALILLPTLQCNAACDYCFEEHSNETLSLEGLEVLITKVLDHLLATGYATLLIHWQGGEVMTLSPSWFAHAQALIATAAIARGLNVRHELQSNLIGYSPRWNDIIREMFDNRVSTSLDVPNLHRHRAGRDCQDYDALLIRAIQQARAVGIKVSAIAVPNAATLELGADAFYSHFVDTLGIRSFQVNTPFPGGALNAVKRDLPQASPALIRFYTELADVWLARGPDDDTRVGPFDELLAYFRDQPSLRPCIWTDDCARHMLCIDARGHVAQCDCWVSSYPDWRFGNLFEAASLTALLAANPVRERFHQRPAQLLAGDCLDCDFLALCHGGCPVRAYSVHGRLGEKDPHCDLYRALFAHLAAAAARCARVRPPARSPAPCQ
ncbi:MULTISPECIES: radical SAM/SPASM domain-containing protein [Thiorhodovibrio]|uniref:radical SAM/SPASM domain-containing protein n=1 Tax=Thiorhodovibrio TaxID=61593 RepID=UPI0019133E25|nr:MULTISPECIES: radical SAM protein [Thiorhodovibrio]MBK5967229.1 SPASM domain-containing protein [Thiorhodovibrio winogradskyi]WPL14880.1 Anaerobic sulfatase-maturating enzyme YdeM [Thiorhodovibrio litoralis]